ncbi:DUF1800 domain-containing protein [Propionibacteriaceae bacterium Y1685]
MAQISEDKAVRRLLDRLGLGGSAAELETAKKNGFDQTVRDLVTPGADPAADETPPPKFEPYEPVPKGDEAAKKARRKQQQQDGQELTRWWLDRMTAVSRPTPERLAWFWHGHFATSMQKVRNPRLMLGQYETMRQFGGGDFAELARAMVVDPAMLIWLDGNDNTAEAANENLAREFMELFTLGHGQYSESDVKEAARALTGWTIDRRTGRSRLARARHDGGSKTVLGVTANFDADSLVDHLLGVPAATDFVISRVWFRLVGEAGPSPEAMQRLRTAYGKDRQVNRLLAGIADEDAFGDSASTLVKQPVDWLVGLCRAAGVRPAKLNEKAQRRLLALLRGMGQLPFSPPSVGGWQSGSAWLTTAAAMARTDLARLVVSVAGTEQRKADPVELLGLDRVSDRSAAAIRQAPKAQRLAVVACAPEFVVSL